MLLGRRVLARTGALQHTRPRRIASSASAFPEAQFIWKNGALVPWKDAQLHVLSTAVQFGSSLFEGMRCYPTPEGPAIVHLEGHLKRLIDSCKMCAQSVLLACAPRSVCLLQSVCDRGACAYLAGTVLMCHTPLTNSLPLASLSSLPTI